MPTFRFNEIAAASPRILYSSLFQKNAISSKKHGGVRKLPWAFTEQGGLMAANLLNSRKAVEISVFIIRAFIKMREHWGLTQVREKRLAEIEKAF
jgi:hypothetical protein